ncbi:MAG: phosphoglycolate phosphatase, partial [Candidatus Methanomethylicota archaeon]
MNSKFKAVAVDIDGTIAGSDWKISCEAIKAIRNLEAYGIKVILASGNALCVVKALSRYIGCTGALVAENGGVVEYKGVTKFLGDPSRAKAALEAIKARYGQVSESWSNRYR